MGFLQEFYSETDRAAVVLGAAKIDLLLGQILQKILRPSPRGDDELLDGDRPLGTFSAKINLLHRLGYIDSHFARTLHLIRKIRNTFAHEVGGATLVSGAHIDRVKELTAPFKNDPWFYKLADLPPSVRKNMSNVSLEFRVALAMIVGWLDLLFERSGFVTPPHCLMPFQAPEASKDTSQAEKPTTGGEGA